jgi:hypothetical protein
MKGTLFGKKNIQLKSSFKIECQWCGRQARDAEKPTGQDDVVLFLFLRLSVLYV